MANVQSCFKRYEKKYRLTPAQQRMIIEGMREHMTADEHAAYTICDIYYDTADWSLIRTSLEKPVYKEKLRIRSYGTPTDGGKVFVELKKKYDGVVYKRRITAPAAGAEPFLAGVGGDAYGQIGREIQWFQSFHRAQPRVFIAYDRLGLTTEYCEILNVRVPCVTIPVGPGRNLAVILELAAMNNRQKGMGYNAAQKLAAEHDRGIDLGIGF